MQTPANGEPSGQPVELQLGPSTIMRIHGVDHIDIEAAILAQRFWLDLAHRCATATSDEEARRIFKESTGRDLP